MSETVVGKFGVLLKIVADYMSETQTSFDGQNLTGPKKAKSQIHPLPLEHPDFKWRLRCDLRQGLNIPSDRPDGQPSAYVEMGWKHHPTPPLEDGKKVMSNLVEENHFPDFNEQLLLHNPKDVNDVSGFVELSVKVKGLP